MPAPSPTMNPSRSRSKVREACRIVVSLRQRPHGGEPADPKRRDARFRTAANHGVRIAALNDLERIADRMRAGSAGRRGGGVRPFRARTDGNIAGCEVDDGRGNEKRRDAPGAVLQQVPVFALDNLKPADAAAHVDADALRILPGHPESRGRERVIAGRNTHLNEAAHLLDIFFLDEAGGIEMLDLTRDLTVKCRRIEGFNARDAVAAFEQSLPGLLRGVADCTQQTNTGDYNSAGNNRSPLTRRSYRNALWASPPIGCFRPPASDYFFLLSI